MVWNEPWVPAAVLARLLPRLLTRVLTRLLMIAAATLAANAVQARVVAIDLDLPLDQVAPGTGGIKVGDHHRARIFYDTSKVNGRTHRVRPLHMQHLVGGQWIPVRLDPIAMPMDDSWLDLSTSPYTYHYHAVAANGLVTSFDETGRRMTILRGDGAVLVSAPYIVDPTPVQDPALYTLRAPPSRYVMHDVDIRLDQAAAATNGRPSRVGSIDKVRVIYDASLIDPRTHHVHLTNFQHYVNGAYSPAHADATAMPMRDAWLDLSRKPYRIHFHAAVTHGVPILIDVDENSRRLSIRSQAEPNGVLMAGPYSVDPEPLMGADVDSAANAATP